MVKAPLGAESWRVDRERGLGHRLPRTRVHPLRRTLFRHLFHRQPHCVTVPVAIASVEILLRSVQRTAEFAAPNEQRIFQNSSLLHISQHSSDRLVGRVRSGFVNFHQCVVLIPEFVADFDISNSGFDQSYFRKLCLTR